MLELSFVLQDDADGRSLLDVDLGGGKDIRPSSVSVADTTMVRVASATGAGFPAC